MISLAFARIKDRLWCVIISVLTSKYTETLKFRAEMLEWQSYLSKCLSNAKE